MRRPTGETVKLEPALLKFADRNMLRAFYVRQYATTGCTSHVETPFLRELR